MILKEILNIFNHAVVISLFVFSMMVIIDFTNVITKNRLNLKLSKNRLTQYIISPLLGATPGCLGAFMVDSFYIHGLVSFGAIVGTMIATSGDEQFVMLVKFPKTALLLFFLLFVSGIIFGFITDIIVKKGNIKTCENCNIKDFHQEDANKLTREIKLSSKMLQNFSIDKLLSLSIITVLIVLPFINIIKFDDATAKYIFISLNIIVGLIVLISNSHYIKVHIYKHIIKSHLLRIFLWTFGVLLVIKLSDKYINLEPILQHNMYIVLLISALVGIIPESGPHLFFVILFSQGSIPFSVLFTSSFVQDGHGLLPLLSYSLKDSILIKIFNIIYGILIGTILYLAGI